MKDSLKHAPLISVLLPNYNHGRFLRQAFESILSQTYSNFEILFTDDGSRDESCEIAQSFASRDARFRPVFFSANRGSLVAAQDARDRAAGELLFAASADDFVVSSRFFEAAVNSLGRFPQAAGFYGTARTISTETGDRIGSVGAGHRLGYLGPGESLVEFLHGRVMIPGTSSIWRRTLVDETGPYDLELGPLADYFANHALAARYGVVYGGEELVCSRVSESHQSYSSSVSRDDLVAGLRLFEARFREWTGNPRGMDAAWDHWRREQAIGAAIRFSSFQRHVASTKRAIRAVLPPPLFNLLNVAWRHTAGRLQRTATRVSPASRHIEHHIQQR